MKKRIAILFREEDRKHVETGYVISYLAKIWRENGIDVVNTFGPNEYIDADLAIVHIDLSVVPDAYLKLASRYPKALNINVKDIRKSTISQNIVLSPKDYNGPVIVKSNLNFAGIPEQRGKIKLFSKIRHLFKANSSSHGDYKVYSHALDVPSSMFNNGNFIVEKFLPEKKNDLYHVRTYHFLGSQYTCARLSSKSAIVSGSSQVGMESIEPHPDIIKLRVKMNFDYGKFDYVIHDGKAILLDANKTVGAGALKYTQELKDLHHIRARGIYDFL